MHKYDTALGARPLPTVQKITENIPWGLLLCNWASKLKLFIVRTFKTISLAAEGVEMQNVALPHKSQKTKVTD